MKKSIAHASRQVLVVIMRWKSGLNLRTHKSHIPISNWLGCALTGTEESGPAAS